MQQGGDEPNVAPLLHRAAVARTLRPDPWAQPSGYLLELDALKDQGKNQDIRQKAWAAGQAIKELRNRGSLVEGVQLKNGVRVVSRPLEPSFARLPAGLDPAVPDDRILGSALELQREHPAATVILVTGDINLQTKAELGGLPYIEPPSASSAQS